MTVRDESMNNITWQSSFARLDSPRDCPYVKLQSPSGCRMESGSLAGSAGLGLRDGGCDLLRGNRSFVDGDARGGAVLLCGRCFFLRGFLLIKVAHNFRHVRP